MKRIAAVALLALAGCAPGRELGIAPQAAPWAAEWAALMDSLDAAHANLRVTVVVHDSVDFAPLPSRISYSLPTHEAAAPGLCVPGANVELDTLWCVLQGVPRAAAWDSLTATDDWPRWWPVVRQQARWRELRRKAGVPGQRDTMDVPAGAWVAIAVRVADRAGNLSCPVWARGGESDG